jgi:methyl-accepting chemotaxis protein
MVLPALGAAAKVTGKRALGAVTKPLADMKDQITSPIMQMVNPVKDLYKEIKSEMGSGDADKTADAVKESGDKQVTSIDQVNQSIINLTNTLESYFSKQSEMAEGQLRSDDTLDPSTPDPDAVKESECGDEQAGPSSKWINRSHQ